MRISNPFQSTSTTTRARFQGSWDAEEHAETVDEELVERPFDTHQNPLRGAGAKDRMSGEADEGDLLEEMLAVITEGM